MLTVLWIIQILLAIVFLLAGFMKLTQSKEKITANMDWADEYSPGIIKFIGFVEVLGAIGLVVPAVTGIAIFLVPLAAVGLAVIMLLAIFMVHVPRKETQNVLINTVILLLALFTAFERFSM